jgi:hypothetical protein
MPRRRLTSLWGMVRSCPVAFSAWYRARASWSSTSSSSWALMITASGWPWSVIVVRSRRVDARRTSDPAVPVAVRRTS